MKTDKQEKDVAQLDLNHLAQQPGETLEQAWDTLSGNLEQ